MPRYFFDLSDGTREPDEEGIVLDSLAEAEREAVRFCGDVLRHEPHRLLEGTLRVDVRDGSQALLFTIRVVKEPSTRR